MNKIGGNIPLYNTPPNGNILCEELENLITTRHGILHNIETKLQGRYDVDYKYDCLKHLVRQCEKEMGWETQLENDNTSHFILSLAFCKNDQERIWFANQESKFFMSRLSFHGVDYEEVLKNLNIPLQRQDNLPTNLLEKIRFRGQAQSGSVYRIPFEYALNLIPTMNYFLNKGFVYISKTEIAQLIETVFKENLIKKLALLNKNLEKVLRDPRISYLIKDFQTKREVEVLSKTFRDVSSSEIINHKEVDANVDKSFPLCMQMTHKALTKNGHLRYTGRIQYGLFLKGIGLSLEDSLIFWKNKFKNTPEDKFNKEYAYSIRFNYGKEGKRHDYIPYSCYKVQNLPPPSNDETHGCPFKNFSEEKLRMLLFEMKFKELDVLKILEKKRNNEFSVNYIVLFDKLVVLY